MRKIACQMASIRGFSALKPWVSKPDWNPMESGGKIRPHRLELWALGLAVAAFTALRIAAVYSSAEPGSVQFLCAVFHHRINYTPGY